MAVQGGSVSQQPYPAVQHVENVVRGGLSPPLQDFREEQELEQSSDIRPRPPGVGGLLEHLNQSSLSECS